MVDWDFAWRIVTAMAWFLSGLMMMRFGSIIRSDRPPAFRIAGMFTVAGAFALGALAHFPEGEVWRDITRYMATGSYLFLSYGLWKSGTQALRLYQFRWEPDDDGSD